MIHPNDIQRILDATRIEEVVGEFVTLKRKGKDLWGLCPFHNEKTASFSVAPAKGIFKCFGCGKAGNSVNFLMEHERYSYPEALKYLAKKYGIEIVEGKPDPEFEKSRSEQDLLFAIHEHAQEFFNTQLWDTDMGRSIGLSYFRERGFTDSSIRKFQLGFSPDTNDAYFKKASHDGYKTEYLVSAGLISETYHNDRFKGRVIFPIHSISGRVLAFAGRILSSDKTKAKYVNSPETPIYHKSNVLYGLFLAKNAIVNQDNCYLVEGYTDVISLHQSGIENVVASSGTSLTLEQIRLIHRYTPNITILYDGDAAGIKASFRGIDMILSEGMQVRVVLFPDGEDPDSYSRNNSSTVVQSFLVEEARSFIIFKASILLKESENDPIKKATAIREIVKSISVIPDAISRSVYITQCAQEFEIQEQVLVLELNKMLRDQIKKSVQAQEQFDPIFENEIAPKQEQTDFSTKQRIHLQERRLLQLLLNSGNDLLEYTENDERGKPVSYSIPAATRIFGDLDEDGIEFTEPINKTLFNIIKNNWQENALIDSNIILSQVKQEMVSYVVDLLASPYALSSNWLTMHKIDVQHTGNSTSILSVEIDESVLVLKALIVRLKMDEIAEKMKLANDNEGLMLLQAEFAKLKKMEITINHTLLNRVIIK